MVRERVERGGSLPPTQLHNGLSVAELRQLIRLMDTSDLEELIIEQESIGLRLVLRKPAPLPPLAESPRAASGVFDDPDAIEEDTPTGEDEEPEEHTIEVRSPMVGVFRAALKADAAPLIAADDEVHAGQVIGAIEALNVLTEVEAQVAGHVAQMLVADGDAVEYGSPLVRLAPPRAPVGAPHGAPPPAAPARHEPHRAPAPDL